MSDEDGYTSDDRNMLRAVASYGDTPVTAGEISRNLGISRQAASAQAAALARCGVLEAKTLAVGRAYRITTAGQAELDAHKTTVLLVEVDDRLAGDIVHFLSPEFVNGVVSVTEHGSGCCCKNCPWRGNHG